jgi:hypothetical protein
MPSPKAVAIEFPAAKATQALLFDFQSLARLSRELAFATEILLAGNQLFNLCIFCEQGI